MRRLLRLTALIAALALVAGCRLGDPDPALFDEARLAHALALLKARIGQPGRALAVEISEDSLTLELQDPAQPTHVDRWRLAEVVIPLSFWQTRSRRDEGCPCLSWESLSGPEPVALNLINPRLEENLFALDEVDFAAVGRLTRAALERTALEEPGRVSGMRIARHLSLLLKPHSGAVEWTVEVQSPRERAAAIADAKGVIQRLNLDGTRRAQTLDMYAGGKPLEEAVAEIRRLWGTGPSLLKVRFATSYISFLARDLEDATRERWYSANLNGISVPLGELAATNLKMPGVARLERFAIDEVDWSQLPKREASARTSLAIADGAIQAVEVSKPARDFGAPRVQWEIAIKGPREEGSAIFAASGEVLRIELPPARRPAVSYLDPPAMAESVAAVNAALGAHARIMELFFTERALMVTAEEPRKPGALGAFNYEKGELKRALADPSQALWHGFQDDWFFEAPVLDAAVIERLQPLKEATLERLALPGGKIERITFSRNKVLDPASREVQIEIRVEGEGGKGGWVDYSLAGAVLHVMTP